MSMYSCRLDPKPTGSHGNMYVVTPKNKTEQKKFEREIKKTGTIKADYQLADSDQVSGFSAISEEEITPKKPSKKSPKKKAPSSVRTSRSQRRTR
jgi:hypothetical protein